LARPGCHAAGREKAMSTQLRAASQCRKAASIGTLQLEFFLIQNILYLIIMVTKLIWIISKNQTHYLILTYLLIISMITVILF
jgi:hypothetical protein